MSYLQKLKEVNLEKITNEGLKNLISKNIEQFDESKATEKGIAQLKTIYEMVEKKFPDALRKDVKGAEPKKEEQVKEKETKPVKAVKTNKAKGKAPKKENKKKIEKEVKISSVNPKDNTPEVKKLLEDEHYKVIVKTVGNKKHTIRVKRSDKEVVAEKIKSAITTCTKKYDSKDEKDEYKDTLKVAKSIEATLIGFMSKIYLLVKDNDTKKLKEILDKFESVQKMEHGGWISKKLGSFSKSDYEDILDNYKISYKPSDDLRSKVEKGIDDGVIEHEYVLNFGKGGSIIKKINGYDYRYNPMFKTWQVSHKEIGANIAEFDTEKEAIEYCKKG
jgi:hypothetical protein